MSKERHPATQHLVRTLGIFSISLPILGQVGVEIRDHLTAPEGKDVYDEKAKHRTELRKFRLKPEKKEPSCWRRL